MATRKSDGYPTILCEVRKYDDEPGTKYQKDREGNRIPGGKQEPFLSRILRFECAGGALTGICKVWGQDNMEPLAVPFKRGDTIALPIKSFVLDKNVIQATTEAEWVLALKPIKG